MRSLNYAFILLCCDVLASFITENARARLELTRIGYQTSRVSAIPRFQPTRALSFIMGLSYENDQQGLCSGSYGCSLLRGASAYLRSVQSGVCVGEGHERILERDGEGEAVQTIYSIAGRYRAKSLGLI